MPANLVRVATGRAWPVVPGPGRVKRAARIVRSCCLVRALQLLPVAAWAVGRAAWFAVICWSITAALAVICCLVPGPGAGGCLVAQLLPGSVFVFVFLVGPCL